MSESGDPYSVWLGYFPVLAFGVAGVFAFLDGANYAAVALLGVSGAFGNRWMDKVEENHA